MNTQPQLIIVEGVDGTGKTTLGQNIAQCLDGLYLTTPQKPFSQIRQDVEAMREPYLRFLFYLSSILGVQKVINETLKNGQSVVVDRYIYSTVIMHQHLGVDVSCINIDALPIRQADIIILTTATQDTRKERLRGKKGSDSHIEANHKLLNDAERSFLAIPDLTEIIDTTTLSVEEATNKALMAIQRTRS